MTEIIVGDERRRFLTASSLPPGLIELALEGLPEHSYFRTYCYPPQFVEVVVGSEEQIPLPCPTAIPLWEGVDVVAFVLCADEDRSDYRLWDMESGNEPLSVAKTPRGALAFFFWWLLWSSTALDDAALRDELRGFAERYGCTDFEDAVVLAASGKLVRDAAEWSRKL